MKHLLKVFFAVMLLVATVISAVSCGSDSNVDENGNFLYGEFGFFYRLPPDMDKKTVSYASILHSNREATFMMTYLDTEGLEENEFDPDIKINRYADKFILLNHYDGTEYNYDKESGKVDFFFEKTFDEGEESEETVLYYHLLIRNDYAVYIVTMHCDISLKDKYTPIFTEWGSYIYVAE